MSYDHSSIGSNTDGEYKDGKKESRKLGRNSEAPNRAISCNDWSKAQEKDIQRILEYDTKNDFYSYQTPKANLEDRQSIETRKIIKSNKDSQRFTTQNMMFTDSDEYNLRHESNHVISNGGARPKNSNSSKQFNSFANIDEMRKDFTQLPKSHYEYSRGHENYSDGHLNTEYNDELCLEMNRGKSHSPSKHECVSFGTNHFTHSKFFTEEISENRFSRNIIDSERNVEQHISRQFSTRYENPNNKYIQNNTAVYEKCGYGKIPNRNKSQYSGFNVHDVPLTTPKTINFQSENNLLSNMHDKTDEIYSSSKSIPTSFELKKYNENKKSELIKYAKDIADFIVGCERALCLFKSFYDEWSAKRSRSIEVLEQIVLAINSSSKKGQTIKRILSAIKLAADIGNVVSPNIIASLGLKITAAAAGIFSMLISNDMNKKDLEEKEFEIKEIFQQDMDLSSLVYIFGMQCGTQFQETCSLISEFHRRIQLENFTSVIEDENVTEYLNEISEYNPKNFTVFYKRLKLGYERLILSSKSKESKAFCRVFDDVPEAVNIVHLLPWKFDTDGFDHTIVQPYWQELFDFLYDSESENIDDFLRKVQECLFFLKKERGLLMRSVLSLFKEEDLEKEKP